MTPEEVTKIRELLTHEDAEIQNQGLELAKSFGDYSAVFEGCQIGEDAQVKLSVPTAVPSEDTCQIEGDEVVGWGVCASIDLSHDSNWDLNNLILGELLQSGQIDPLTIFTLDLSNNTSLTNVDALAGLTNLTSLNLAGCSALENVDGLAGLINLTALSLEGCGALKNVNGLANLTNLTCEWLRALPHELSNDNNDLWKEWHEGWRDNEERMVIPYVAELTYYLANEIDHPYDGTASYYAEFFMGIEELDQNSAEDFAAAVAEDLSGDNYGGELDYDDRYEWFYATFHNSFVGAWQKLEASIAAKQGDIPFTPTVYKLIACDIDGP